MLTPHACSATVSRSLDSRPRPINTPTSNAIGMVIPSPCGTSVAIIRTMVAPPTPLAIKSSATCMIGGSISRNVKTRRLSPNGGMTSRRMYRLVTLSMLTVLNLAHPSHRLFGLRGFVVVFAPSSDATRQGGFRAFQAARLSLII